ncbi:MULTISPECIES: polyphosphate kinase 1 [Weeksella]|uniref:Polyphosphate kinase n=1 Tax=Weeksella virosa (strain ATCC 43766 / DSM 16922 / JCM 21250 / CCUG 30538 / CDC 9751 / IAM 14551 / NBRC 16016 / NCTC 11634 / CL345/78) TaxID=865938 RepID=F0P128_WEEVC|nr:MULTISPECIES: polyphosphate kinase 1 [Weeksella]ADX68612.1 polyphosphate kinase 1 [Weeksella virosa DSM 16922]MDK7375856.1 polyphosphate kinase 1 [Weeksella virosa]MDK7676263.1 polyphosphate kinase 1 [Weeksella virosa]OFM82353.1 polyphosphate kinase 1 [Weeksella sp. HMSC059D05]SUP54952.1 Polyphosphate kinase [Weeksella virosa]
MIKYINRELSWLRFNARVLQEAADPTVPLLERIRFLGIYSNNLDEFYSVRYSAILRSIELKNVEKVYKNICEQQTDEELIEEINKTVSEQRILYDELYEVLLEKLKEEKIHVVDHLNIPKELIGFMKDIFYRDFDHTIGVMILDDYLKAPQLRDGNFYLAVKMMIKGQPKYAIVSVPTNLFSRFILLPKFDDNQYVIFIEDIIRYHLNDIFKIFDFDEIEAHSIKITRDSELDIDNDLEHTILEKISIGLEGRKKGEPVRMVYDREIADDTLNYILKKLNLDEFDSINPGGKYHNKSDLMKFPTFGRKDLTYPKITPIQQKKAFAEKSFFRYFSKNDHLMYAPYHDYSLFLKFLREAAIDPKVKKIKITIYRVAKDSQVLNSLINAAINGKDVTTVLELRARFDEANNVNWSKRLQDAGVHVIFGVPGLKVHSKIGYIEREAEEGLSQKYAFISTGNFHAGTAKVYTDYTFFTSKPEITNEIEGLFNFFGANYLSHSYKKLMVSPFQTRKRLVKFIKREIKNKQKGLPAGINLKLNSLSDKNIIDLLYEASSKGVPVRLVVRGIHCLIPQEKDLSDKIHSISVVDKFLEHPRVYWFCNGGENSVYISSADIMERNLDFRIEVACPIEDPKLKQIVMDTFDLSFTDNVKARIHDKTTSLTYQINDLPHNRSQFTIYDYLQQLEEGDEN